MIFSDVDDMLCCVGLRNEEIDCILEAVAQEEKYLRQLQLADMKKGWDDQLTFKTNAKKDGRAREIDDFKNGPTMDFAGEDKLYPQRKAAQQAQMRRWTQEDVEARARQKAKEMEEERVRAELARNIDEFREQQEREEERMRKELTKRILQENGDVRYPIIIVLLL
jgi:superfamily II RNA helicase